MHAENYWGVPEMKNVVALTATAGLVVAMVPFAASAKPVPKAAVRPAVTASQDKGCTLSPSLTHPGGDEASCISVGARLSSVPRVGGKTLLTISVKVARSEPRTKVTVDLPSTFAFADGTTTHSAMTGHGTVARAVVATLNMAKGQTRTLTRVVKAVGSGFGAITASAANRLSAQRTDGGTDSVFVTTGSSAVNTFRGGGAAQSASQTHSTVRLPLRSGGPERVSSTPSRAAPVTVAGASRTARIRPSTAGQQCATGTWNFQDQNGISRPAANTLVEVLNSSNTLLSYAVSGGDGSYTICWATTASTVYVKFVESNNIWRVTDNSNNVYSFSTALVSVPDGTTHNFGNLFPGSSSAYPGLHAFAIANDEWQWVHQYFGGQCWSPYETSCLQLTIHWQSDSTTGTFWNTSGVYLKAGSPDTVDEPAHEIGHNLMYELYGQSFPATTNCNPHFLFTASSTTCAMTEGWADWVATSVYNNTTWTFNGGSTTSFDTTWGDGQNTGDQVEGRIVQAMRSLTDGTKAPWDNDPGEGAGVRDNRNFFAVLHAYRPTTFAAFWNDRASAGQDVSQTALSALYEGTIDYGFRNPLSDYVPKHFPEAVPDHNYSHTATTGFWSVVAARPDAGSDTDLSVYTDFGQGTLLDSSAFGGTVTDFVAINSNSGHRALQTYFPRVHQFGGTGGYTIQEAQGSNSLSTGSNTFAFTSGQLIRIFDSFQGAGVPVFYRAVPSAGQDVQLAVASADLNAARRSATTDSSDPGAGNPAALVFTPTASGWHGLMVLDNSVTAGNVTLYADTSAPTGAVSINSGAASTTHPNVTLTLSAADAETGVTAMQVSTDGVFDTEPVVPFSTSGTANLPAPNGIKTVSVRYENNAGMWSTPATDTITLHASPKVTSVSPVSGPTGGGRTVTITGSRFTGATAVKFGATAATGVTVVSATKITAVSPAHAGGTVDVHVVTPYGHSAVSRGDRYTYQAAPTVTGVSSASAAHAGGKKITVTGTHFVGASVVKFGTKKVTTFTVVSPKTITVHAPAHAAGNVNVHVKTPSGTSASAPANKFSFT
jgi:hypothetical protein